MSSAASTTTSGARPLAGVKVIDITSVMLGPYATQMLGDYGADVIKIEGPEGDSTRSTGPGPIPGMAATFVGANRSKRSVVLDLKQVAAREVLHTLLASADVLICSVRPQKMRALDLDLKALRVRHPHLIVVSVVGFAEGGPYAGRPAYDDIIQGLCGLAALGATQGGEPAYVPSVIADKTCALFAVQAVLLALTQRHSVGHGCFVEVPMFESMVNFTLVEHFYGLQFRPALSQAGYQRLLTPWRKPYPTSDGYVCIVPYSTQHWQQFFTEVGEPTVMQDERFATLESRTRHIDVLYAKLAHHTPQRSTEEWLQACNRLDIPAAPMHRLDDLETDPHLAASGFFQHRNDPHIGAYVMPSAPLTFDGARAEYTPPPRLGEHTLEVMREVGIPADTIESLLVSGAAQSSDTPPR